MQITFLILIVAFAVLAIAMIFLGFYATTTTTSTLNPLTLKEEDYIKSIYLLNSNDISYKKSNGSILSLSSIEYREKITEEQLFISNNLMTVLNTDVNGPYKFLGVKIADTDTTFFLFGSYSNNTYALYLTSSLDPVVLYLPSPPVSTLLTGFNVVFYQYNGSQSTYELVDDNYVTLFFDETSAYLFLKKGANSPVLFATKAYSNIQQFSSSYQLVVDPSYFQISDPLINNKVFVIASSNLSNDFPILYMDDTLLDHKNISVNLPQNISTISGLEAYSYFFTFGSSLFEIKYNDQVIGKHDIVSPMVLGMTKFSYLLNFFIYDSNTLILRHLDSNIEIIAFANKTNVSIYMNLISGNANITLNTFSPSQIGSTYLPSILPISQTFKFVSTSGAVTTHDIGISYASDEYTITIEGDAGSPYTFAVDSDMISTSNTGYSFSLDSNQLGSTEIDVDVWGNMNISSGNGTYVALVD